MKMNNIQWEGRPRSKAVVILAVLLCGCFFWGIRGWSNYRNERVLNDQLMGLDYFLVPAE